MTPADPAEYAQAAAVAGTQSLSGALGVVGAVAADAVSKVFHVHGDQSVSDSGPPFHPVDASVQGLTQEQGNNVDSAPKMKLSPQARAGDMPSGPTVKLSSISCDMGTAAEGRHVEIKQDVILRLETLTSKETKYIIAVIWIASALAFGALIAEFTVKLKRNSSSKILHQNTISTINVAVASILSVQLLRSLTWFTVVVLKTWTLKRVWKPRRAKSVIIFFVEIGAQTINVAAYLAMNALAIHDNCSFLKPRTTILNAIQWTCWNTIFLAFCIQVSNECPVQGSRTKHKLHAGVSAFQSSGKDESPMIILDGPVWLHGPKFALWVVTEALVIALSFYQHFHSAKKFQRMLGSSCSYAEFTCHQDWVQIFLTSLVCFCILLYCLWFCKYLMMQFARLQRLPYTEWRVTNLLARIHLRTRFPFISSFVLCFVLLFAVKIHSCFSFAVAWQGLLPMQVVETAVIVAWSFIAMPKDPKGKPPLMQVWLEEFCWTYSSKAGRIAKRNQSAPDDPVLAAAPMFCFEDALKTLYWTLLVYDYKQAERTILNLDRAKELYRLEGDELLWEPLHDTKCLMAWGPDTILLVFRGTASFKNAKADIQAWRVVHPPARGRYWMGQQPQVHAGFLKSWLAGDLKERVIARVLLQLQQHKGNTVKRVVVTGHSLGGALATLCAFDIAAAIRDSASANSQPASSLPAQHSHSHNSHNDGSNRDVNSHSNGGSNDPSNSQSNGDNTGGNTGVQRAPQARVCCYTFGAPRTGNRAFMKEYNALLPDSWALINDQDVVTRGGKMVWLYSRPGQRVLINARGDMIVRPSWVEASLRRLPGGSVNHHLLAQYTNSMCAIILQQFDSKLLNGGVEGIVQMCHQNPVLATMLERYMGLSMDQMQQVLEEQAAGSRSKLAGAKLPKLGFYVRESDTADTEKSKFFACC